MTAPERIVQAQLDAYNARDLAAFTACYAGASRFTACRPWN